MHSRALVGWKIERSTRRAALRSVLIDSDAARLTGQAVLRLSLDATQPWVLALSRESDVPAVQVPTPALILPARQLWFF